MSENSNQSHRPPSLDGWDLMKDGRYLEASSYFNRELNASSPTNASKSNGPIRSKLYGGLAKASMVLGEVKKAASALDAAAACLDENDDKNAVKGLAESDVEKAGLLLRAASLHFKSRHFDESISSYASAVEILNVAIGKQAKVSGADLIATVEATKESSITICSIPTSTPDIEDSLKFKPAEQVGAVPALVLPPPSSSPLTLYPTPSPSSPSPPHRCPLATLQILQAIALAGLAACYAHRHQHSNPPPNHARDLPEATKCAARAAEVLEKHILQEIDCKCAPARRPELNLVQQSEEATKRESQSRMSPMYSVIQHALKCFDVLVECLSKLNRWEDGLAASRRCVHLCSQVILTGWAFDDFDSACVDGGRKASRYIAAHSLSENVSNKASTTSGQDVAVEQLESVLHREMLATVRRYRATLLVSQGHIMHSMLRRQQKQKLSGQPRSVRITQSYTLEHVWAVWHFAAIEYSRIFDHQQAEYVYGTLGTSMLRESGLDVATVPLLASPWGSRRDDRDSGGYIVGAAGCWTSYGVVRRKNNDNNSHNGHGDRCSTAGEIRLKEDEVDVEDLFERAHMFFRSAAIENTRLAARKDADFRPTALSYIPSSNPPNPTDILAVDFSEVADDAAALKGFTMQLKAYHSHLLASAELTQLRIRHLYQAGMCAMTYDLKQAVHALEAARLIRQHSDECRRNLDRCYDKLENAGDFRTEMRDKSSDPLDCGEQVQQYSVLCGDVSFLLSDAYVKLAMDNVADGTDIGACGQYGVEEARECILRYSSSSDADSVVGGAEDSSTSKSRRQRRIKGQAQLCVALAVRSCAEGTLEPAMSDKCHEEFETALAALRRNLGNDEREDEAGGLGAGKALERRVLNIANVIMSSRKKTKTPLPLVPSPLLSSFYNSPEVIAADNAPSLSDTAVMGPVVGSEVAIEASGETESALVADLALRDRRMDKRGDETSGFSSANCGGDIGRSSAGIRSAIRKLSLLSSTDRTKEQPQQQQDSLLGVVESCKDDDPNAPSDDECNDNDDDPLVDKTGFLYEEEDDDEQSGMFDILRCGAPARPVHKSLNPKNC